MVRAMRAWWMARGVGLLAVTAAATVLALAGCRLFTTTPFPAFLDKTDTSVDLSSRIDAIAGSKGISSYDLEVVTDPTGAQQPRVLLLAEPPSSDPTNGGYKYVGRIIFMNQDLNVLGEATTASTGYFSKPYSYTVDPAADILAGYNVINQTGTPLDPQPITATGLTGFAFPDAADVRTFVFSTPPGSYTSFDLSFLGYDDSWGIPDSGTLPIIPLADRPSSSDPNFANLGYQLVGLSFDPGTRNVTFVLSKPSTGQIMATRMGLDTAKAGATPLLDSGQSWPVSITVDRPAVGVDSKGLFLVRRDGWMDRYTWSGTGIPLDNAGGPVEIVGDRSLTRQYAFLVDSSGGGYMYRFDPSSRVLTRYKRWW